jgi:coenzyme PQQ synthesis protein D (PqqD)
MKTEAPRFLPEACREGIITKEVDGELLIYNSARDRAHCLNSSAAAIWNLCDGRTTPSEIAHNLGSNPPGTVPSPTSSVQSRHGATDRASSPPVREGTRTRHDSGTAEQLVWLGLEELRRKHLLEESAKWPATTKEISGMSRREALRRIGLGAAIALPIVISITAPTPAQAGSCKHANANCATPVECCSGSCDTVTTHKCIGG